MNDRVAAVLDTLPEQPGIYIMKNSHGQVLYVGKALSLRNRVRQYFHESTLRQQPKTRRLVQDIADIGYIVVHDEAEALLLECNLIKHHHPKYNIRLKDNKNFPYIRINLKEDFPRAEIVRKRLPGDTARYFGPYTNAGSMRLTMDAVRKVFPMRSCGKDIARAVANGERSCLNAQIGRCLAPCTGRVTREEYHNVALEVCRFLQGGHEDIIRKLRQDMQRAADELEFERAASLRDKLTSVIAISGDGRTQAAVSSIIGNADIAGMYAQGEEDCVALMFMRGGKLMGGDSFILEGVDEENSQAVLSGFLNQFYAGSTIVPEEIILGDPPGDAAALCQALMASSGHKVSILSPQRGEKRRLLEIAQKNAKDRLERERVNRERTWQRTGGAVKALGELLKIPPPGRIECYDISNIQGTDSVASMVVFEDGMPKKSQYRRFKIKTVEGANDFESMKEVITRRFTRGLAERAELDEAGGDYMEGSFSRFPDLVVIDGGAIQLRFAMEAMQALGVGDIPAVGLAERFDHIIPPGDAGPIVLPRSSATLHLLERARDEAHRFAVTYHRSLRQARTLKSRLEEIPGIGEKRRKALLRAYPIPEQLKNASLEELAAVEGMNATSARAVYEALRREEAPTADAP